MPNRYFRAAGTFALITRKDVTASRTEFGVRTDKSLCGAERHPDAARRAAGRMISTSTATSPRCSRRCRALPLSSTARRRPTTCAVTAAADMKWLNGFSLSGTFEGQFSNVTNSYAGKGVARYSW